MTPRFIALAFLTAWLAIAGTAFATFRETVLGVGANTIAIQMQPHSSATFKVPANAMITVDDLPSKLTDVRAGMTVTVSMGLDRDSVQEIVAHTVPPAVPKKVTINRNLFKPISGTVVISVTDQRITYGTLGGSEAKAALMMPTTRVYMDNAPINASALEVGMQVSVVTMDGVHAREVRILGQDKDQ